jgi:cytidine deaminase
MKNIKFKDLKRKYQLLLNEAEKAASKAYAPYSRFQVGAALLTQKGLIIGGANVENASYGLCICAERAALINANTQGERRFKALAMIARGGADGKKIISPCGACRQMLFEFSENSGIDLEILMSNFNKSKIVIAKISELLPLAYGANDLGIKI